MPTCWPTLGVSEEAQAVAKATQAERRDISRTNALGRSSVFDELGAVWEECRHSNWDGYDALPVTWETLQHADRLIESLPLGTSLPSVGAEPDGALTLEWHQSRRRTLSVSVTAEGELHYAALLGPNRAFGTEAFFGEIPQKILGLIQQVCRP
jgi:hypothetical protein